ncbi:hypothetical protein, partial [Parageobacillus toebii]|uniref:hypothetical protein n=1 Tax=Parageobacillus toebii TaxID=153151 RepID=UPI001F3E3B25
HAASVRPEPGSNSPKRKLIGLFNSAPTPKVSSASAFLIVQLQRLALLCQITFPLEVQALQRVKNIWLRELIAALQFFLLSSFGS